MRIGRSLERHAWVKSQCAPREGVSRLAGIVYCERGKGASLGKCGDSLCSLLSRLWQFGRKLCPSIVHLTSFSWTMLAVTRLESEETFLHVQRSLTGFRVSLLVVRRKKAAL